MNSAIFGNFFGDFFGLGTFDEPPDSVPLRILGIQEMPADEKALRAAFCCRVLKLHPDLNPLDEGSWRNVRGDEWEEVQWARSVLQKKLPKPGHVTDDGVDQRVTLSGRNGSERTRPVTDRTSLRLATLVPRNARLFAEVEAEFARRQRTIDKEREAGRPISDWTPWGAYRRMSEDERWTEIAVAVRLVCSDCVHPLDGTIFLHRSDGDWVGDGLKARCATCWEAKKANDTFNWDREGRKWTCGCGTGIVCTGDRYYSTRWWYAKRAQSCSPSCRRDREKADAREKRRAARAGAVCAVCESVFEPRRQGARYCSGSCRQDAYRKRKLGAH